MNVNIGLMRYFPLFFENNILCRKHVQYCQRKCLLTMKFDGDGMIKKLFYRISIHKLFVLFLVQANFYNSSFLQVTYLQGEQHPNT